jgi:hypothetical protein
MKEALNFDLPDAATRFKHCTALGCSEKFERTAREFDQ